MPLQTQGSATQDVAPRTALRAFDQRRSALQDQLTSLTIRRDLLTQQTRNADPAGQAQLKAMIAEVGNQTAQVMKDMAANDAAESKFAAEMTGFQGRGGNTVIGVPPVPPAEDLADKIAVLGAGAL